VRNLVSLIVACSLCLCSCGQNKKANGGEQVSTDSIPVKRSIPIRPTGWVSDFDQLLTAEQVKVLDSIIATHEKETGNEIAVVTYQPDSTQLANAGSFEKFSLDLFNQWGVGKKDKNNGVGLLISSSLRKIRIETGKGLLSKLTDEEAQTIIDTILVPAFRNNDQFAGVMKAVQAIINEIK
jgi:uncharacterized protein